MEELPQSTWSMGMDVGHFLIVAWCKRAAATMGAWLNKKGSWRSQRKQPSVGSLPLMFLLQVPSLVFLEDGLWHESENQVNSFFPKMDLIMHALLHITSLHQSTYWFWRGSESSSQHPVWFQRSNNLFWPYHVLNLYAHDAAIPPAPRWWRELKNKTDL